MDTSPGTPLYNLPLLGEGTAQVESLTSYIVRLARAHYLRPRDLIRRVAGVGCPEIAALCYARFFSRYAITVNGLGKYARLFADRFSELTGNPNLAHATLLPWHRLLAPNGSALLAPHPRWCGQCLMEDVQAGRSPYLRLAWSVGLEKYCTEHHALLEDVCPSCGRVQPAIPQYADLFHCDHCHQPLLSQETLHRPNGAKPAANDLLTTQSVADLIALNAVINPETTHLQFTAQLSREVERRTEGNRAGLCAAVGLQTHALNGWFTKGQRISLGLLVQLYQAIGLKPTFAFSNDCSNKPLRASGTRQRRPRKRQYHSPDLREHARKSLVEAIKSGTTPPSLVEMADRLGVSRGFLRYWHPQLADQLVQERRTVVKRNANLRAEKHEEVIRAAIAVALSQGMWPGRNLVETVAREEHFSLLDDGMFKLYQSLLCEALAQTNATVKVSLWGCQDCSCV